MAFEINCAFFEVDYQCPKCGKIGVYEVKGEEVMNNLYTLNYMLCPECDAVIRKECKNG